MKLPPPLKGWSLEGCCTQLRRRRYTWKLRCWRASPSPHPQYFLKILHQKHLLHVIYCYSCIYIYVAVDIVMFLQGMVGWSYPEKVRMYFYKLIYKNQILRPQLYLFTAHSWASKQACSANRLWIAAMRLYPPAAAHKPDNIEFQNS